MASSAPTTTTTTITADRVNVKDLAILPGREFVSYKNGSKFTLTTSPMLLTFAKTTGEGDINKIMKLPDGDQLVPRTGCKFTWGLAYAGADAEMTRLMPSIGALNEADFKKFYELVTHLMGESFDQKTAKVSRFCAQAEEKAIEIVGAGRKMKKTDAKALYDSKKDAKFVDEVRTLALSNFLDDVPQNKQWPNPAEYTNGFKTVQKRDGTVMQTPLRFFLEKKCWVRKDGYKEVAHDAMPKTLTYAENNGVGANWFAVYDDMSRFYKYQPVVFVEAATGKVIEHPTIKHNGKSYPDPAFDPTHGGDAIVDVTLSFKITGAKTNYGIEAMASYINIHRVRPRAPVYHNPWQSLAQPLAPTETVVAVAAAADDDESSNKRKASEIEAAVAAANEAFGGDA